MFYIDYSSNEVRRNLQFIHIIPHPNTPTSLPINKDNFRKSISLYTARKIIDNKGKDWYKHCDVYFAPIDF
ncbi:hypothetical protein EB001_19890 [bacterium]|nr:hypothetical protein [bacterium]